MFAGDAPEGVVQVYFPPDCESERPSTGRGTSGGGSSFSKECGCVAAILHVPLGNPDPAHPLSDVVRSISIFCKHKDWAGGLQNSNVRCGCGQCGGRNTEQDLFGIPGGYEVVLSRRTVRPAARSAAVRSSGNLPGRCSLLLPNRSGRTFRATNGPKNGRTSRLPADSPLCMNSCVCV